MASTARLIGRFSHVFSVAAAVHVCGVATIAQTPLTDLGAGLYMNQFQGGLYENGLNTPPIDLAGAARNRAVHFVRPRNTNGAVDYTVGKTVFLSVGYSNGHQEFGNRGSFDFDPHTFMGQAESHPVTDQRHLVLMNGARGGQDVTRWLSTANNVNYTRINDDLTAAGLSRSQVQVVWIKQNNRIPNEFMPTLPSSNAEAKQLVGQLGTVARSLRQQYPNLSLAFLGSRTYGGYQLSGQLPHPEPYAYEQGFANKWLIEAQLRQIRSGVIDPVAGDLGPSVAPLLVWGPYLWANGITPRYDGLTWDLTDFEPDRVHPSTSGEQKAGLLMLDFFRTNPISQPWFTDPIPGDATLDGRVDFDDLLVLARNYGTTTSDFWTAGDFGNDGVVDFTDLVTLAQNYSPLASFEADWKTARFAPEPVVVLAVLSASVAGFGRRRL